MMNGEFVSEYLNVEIVGCGIGHPQASKKFLDMFLEYTASEGCVVKIRKPMAISAVTKRPPTKDELRSRYGKYVPKIEYTYRMLVSIEYSDKDFLQKMWDKKKNEKAAIGNSIRSSVKKCENCGRDFYNEKRVQPSVWKKRRNCSLSCAARKKRSGNQTNEEIYKMFSGGMSKPEIARIVGISYTAVVLAIRSGERVAWRRRRWIESGNSMKEFNKMYGEG